MRQALREERAALGIAPTLGILSFATPASRLYSKAQVQQAEAIGFSPPNVVELPFTATATQSQVEEQIRRWNSDPSIHGIFVHQPMPPQVNAQRVSTLIDPRKDIEGVHPQNSARRFFAKSRIG